MTAVALGAPGATASARATPGHAGARAGDDGAACFGTALAAALPSPGRPTPGGAADPAGAAAQDGEQVPATQTGHQPHVADAGVATAATDTILAAVPAEAPDFVAEEPATEEVAAPALPGLTEPTTAELLPPGQTTGEPTERDAADGGTPSGPGVVVVIPNSATPADGQPVPAARPASPPAHVPVPPGESATPVEAAGTQGSSGPGASAASAPAPILAVAPGADRSHGAAPAAPPAPAAAQPAFASLHRQLAGPVASLVAAPDGGQTITVNVAPEGVGPVTVRAQLGADGMRVELSAPTDAGRDALRGLLPDLRRDLAAGGAGSLTLAAGDGRDPGRSPGGHGNQGGDGLAGGDGRGAETGRRPDSAGRPTGGGPEPGRSVPGWDPHAQTPGAPLRTANQQLDVLA